MRKKPLLLAFLLAATGCPDNNGTMVDLSMDPNADMSGADMSGGGGMRVEVSGEINANTTWSKNNTYVLTSHVFVGGGATLTIEAGTQVHGQSGAALVITREGKINAVGTAAAPIVFTSDKPVGQRKVKDWGGVVLLGKAKINAGNGEQPIEGFPPTETRVIYGSMAAPDDTHDCGKLKYARIEFAGFEIAPTKEINSLTVGGCGSKTELDFIQTHLGADDGIEFFGGTANLKHAIVTQANDDGLDWDFGWTGKVQFLIIQQSKANGNFGYESDGNGAAPTAMPYSNPTIYNVTMVGSGPGAAADTQTAMTLRRGTYGKMYNHIILDFTNNVIDIAGVQSTQAAKNGNLLVHNSIFFGNGNQNTMNTTCVLDRTMPATMSTVPAWGGCDDAKGTPSADATESPLVAGIMVNSPANACGAASPPVNCSDGTAGIVESDFFRGMSPYPATNNRFTEDPQLEDPHNLTAPNFKPKAGSPALTGAATPPGDGFFDATATYVGALGAGADWTQGWTAYPAN